MKICLVHEEYPKETNFGGIATYQKILSKELSKLGHQVTVITRGLKENEEYYDDNVKVIRIFNPMGNNSLDDYKKYREEVNQKIIELVNNSEIDIIETPDWGAETIKYLPKRKIPIVVKLHTPLCVWQEYNKSGLGDPLNSEMLKWEKECIYNADKIISCSNILLKKLKKYYQDLDYSKIEVIPNPANLDIIRNYKNHNILNVLYVGSLEQRKGVDILAKAIPIFMEKLDRKDIKFIFIGKDTNRNDKNISMIEYIKNIVPLEYHQDLEFIGQIDNFKINDYYGKCMMGIVPSVFDNLPYVAQEMLLNEMPVIASDNTGVKEMIINYKSGLLFKNLDYVDLANKMYELYSDDNLRLKLINNSRKYILEKHNPKKIVNKMIKLYEETIEEFNNARGN